jgi:hypothetical protein
VTGALTKFDSEKDGVDGVQGLTFPNAMAIAPGDRDLYTVAGYQGSQGSIAGKLSLFARSPVDDTTQYFTLLGDDGSVILAAEGYRTILVGEGGV